MVEIARFNPNPSVRMFAKLEGMNPDGLGEGSDRALPDRRAGARRPADARLGDPRAVVWQHRHLAGDDLPVARLHAWPSSCPTTRPANGARSWRCTAPRSSIHRASSGPTAQLRWHGSWRPMIRATSCPTSTPIPTTHALTTRRLGPRSWPTALSWMSSSAGLGTGGTLMGVGRRLREEKPRSARGCCRANARRASPGAAIARGRLRARDLRRVGSRRALSWSRPRIRSRPCAGSPRPRRSLPAFRRAACWRSLLAWLNRWTSGTIVALLADGGWKYLSEDLWRRDPSDDELEALNLW